jgi:hypothetical protein
MEFTGRTPDKILKNEIADSSSWHFFQARSWLDYAKRSQLPSAIHYAAFEMRYGIEYLLFHLLVLTYETLNRADYERCIGDPKEMKKMLKTHGTSYHLLSEFSATLLTLEPNAPKLVFWDLDKLFRYWGIASEYLHFVGAQTKTYQNITWIIKAIARLDVPLEDLWDSATKGIGIAIMRPSGMEPEVRAAWLEFSAGTLSKEDLKTRMRLIQPVLRKRRS